MAWKAILPKKKPDPKQFLRIVEDKGKSEGIKPATEGFESFVSTWRDAPEIIVEAEDKGGKKLIFTGVKSSWSKGSKAKPEDIFMFLARGTSKRHAVMSDDFSAKTSHRTIKSGAGGGQRDPINVNKGIDMGGIEAREIEEAVKDKYEKEIRERFDKIFEEAAKKADFY